MKKSLIALILGVLMIATVFGGCSNDEQPQQSGPQIEITPSGENVSGSEENPAGEQQSGEQQNSEQQSGDVPGSGEIISEDPIVETEYGNLYYHEQWLGLMKIEQSKEGENIVINFAGEVDGTKYTLFTIIIGSSEEAFVGEITDASGTKREVFAIFEDLEKYSDIAREDFDRLCAMQEDLNYVIENLK